ncbi:hypothetical protein BB777_08665 [Planococcus faecalis]|nr:hypothetical protein BB777_08665 [Planococcus faecalis]
MQASERSIALERTKHIFSVNFACAVDLRHRFILKNCFNLAFILEPRTIFCIFSDSKWLMTMETAVPAESVRLDGGHQPVL